MKKKNYQQTIKVYETYGLLIFVLVIVGSLSTLLTCEYNHNKDDDDDDVVSVYLYKELRNNQIE